MKRDDVKKNMGFTLLELMVVVVIIAIIAAIALPSYTEQVRKSRRAQAQSDLAELTQNMERNFTMTRDYTKASAGGAYVLPFTWSPRGMLTGSAYYDLSIKSSTATTYTLLAAPKNSQASDRCGNLTINSLGQKEHALSTDDVCNWGTTGQLP